MTLPLALVAVCLLGLVYVYGGYLWLLKGLSRVRGRISSDRSVAVDADAAELPPVTVYFSAFNEEQLVLSRIENLVRAGLS